MAGLNEHFQNYFSNAAERAQIHVDRCLDTCLTKSSLGENPGTNDEKVLTQFLELTNEEQASALAKFQAIKSQKLSDLQRHQNLTIGKHVSGWANSQKAIKTDDPSKVLEKQYAIGLKEALDNPLFPGPV